MEKSIKYFIEDEKTNLWYMRADSFKDNEFDFKNIKNLELDEILKTLNKQFDAPFDEWWTNDPNRALPFSTKKSATNFAKTMNRGKKNFKFMKNNNGEIIKLIVTEHKFV